MCNYSIDTNLGHDIPTKLDKFIKRDRPSNDKN